MDGKNSLKVIYVKWLDPHSVDPWTSKEDLHLEPYMVHSVGIFLKETERTIALSLNKADESEDTSCVMVIPKNAILEVYEVKQRLVKCEAKRHKKSPWYLSAVKTKK